MRKREATEREIKVLDKGRILIQDQEGARDRSWENLRRNSNLRKALRQMLDSQEEGISMEDIARNFLREVKDMRPWAVTLFHHIMENYNGKLLKIKSKQNHIIINNGNINNGSPVLVINNENAKLEQLEKLKQLEI